MAVLNVVIIAIASVFAGAVGGWLLGRKSNKAVQQNESLQQQLVETEASLEEYKQEVTGHFEATAELINNLTEAYRHLHNHIAEGANHLTPQTLEAPLLKNLPDVESLEAISIAPTPTDITAPLDYAPKSPSDSGPGMLDESYGLDNDEVAQPSPVESKIND